MDNLVLTIIVAVILMGLVVAALAIGLLITGKSKLRRGCGLAPSNDKKKQCPLCGADKECKEEDNDNDPDDASANRCWDVPLWVANDSPPKRQENQPFEESHITSPLLGGGPPRSGIVRLGWAGVNGADSEARLHHVRAASQADNQDAAPGVYPSE